MWVWLILTAAYTVAIFVQSPWLWLPLYERDGWVLLLGVGHRNNTSFHLSDYRAGYGPEDEIGAALLESGQRVWKVFRDMAWDDGTFPAIGVDFEATGAATVGPVGVSRAHLLPQRLAVDFAERWLRAQKRRQPPACVTDRRGVRILSEN